MARQVIAYFVAPIALLAGALPASAQTTNQAWPTRPKVIEAAHITAE